MASASTAPGLIDSDILIDATRNFADAKTFLSQRRAVDGIWISIVSAMELVAGFRNATEIKQVQQFLERTSVLPISASVSQIAYGWMQGFFLSHGLLIPDALIAATAFEDGLVLYTKNTRHFEMLPGLRVIRPY